MLLEALARPEQFDGCLVDGFPRTVIQVQLLQLLHDKMSELSRRERCSLAERAVESIMPRPHFRMAILFVDENESIRRQLSRGQAAQDHNRRVDEAGEVRRDLLQRAATDTQRGSQCRPPSTPAHQGTGTSTPAPARQHQHASISTPAHQFQCPPPSSAVTLRSRAASSAAHRAS